MPGHTAAHEAASTSHSGHTSSGNNNNQPQETNREKGIRAHATTGSSWTGGVGDPDPPHEYIGGEKVYIGDEIGKQQALEKANIAEAEKVGFWEQVSNVASNLMENSLTGKVLKLGGEVLSKLGEYSSDLQKKAMSYSLNQKVKAKMKTLDLNNPNTMHDPVIADLHKDLADIQTGDFTQSDFNKKYGSPEINVSGGDGQDRELMNIIAPVAPYEVSGTTPIESQAAKWFANMGNSSTGFNLDKAYAAAQAKQKSILGSPSAVGLLAVNQSPFYDFLKLNKIDRGIL